MATKTLHTFKKKKKKSPEKVQEEVQDKAVTSDEEIKLANIHNAI